jgi:hypothetical protein
MDQVIKRTPQNSTPQSTVNGNTPAHDFKRHGRGMKKGFIGLVVLVLVIVVGIIATQRYFDAKDGFAKDIKKSEYQAVFLTNGQVYFGKIDSLTDRGYTLSDIYYLQVQQGVQPDTTKTTSGSQNLSLAKLGNELHGPEDAMYIEKQQVLFWENLKDSGQVVKAIKANQNK